MSGDSERDRELAAAAGVVGIPLDTVKLYAQIPVNVLILGPTGVGKTHLARAMAQYAGHTPTVVNCASIPPTLFEAEMFGAKKGAYSGADKDRPGHVVRTGTGTLVLDEVGDLDIALQAKVLHLIQDREYFMVGAATPRKAQFHRVIAATQPGKVVRDDLRGRFPLVLRVDPLWTETSTERLRHALPGMLSRAASEHGLGDCGESEPILREFMTVWQHGDFSVAKYGLRALEKFVLHWGIHRRYAIPMPDADSAPTGELPVNDFEALLDRVAASYVDTLDGEQRPLQEALRPDVKSGHPYADLVLRLAEKIARRALAPEANTREKRRLALFGTRHASSDAVKALLDLLDQPSD